jgi:hypothetical protein
MDANTPGNSSSCLKVVLCGKLESAGGEIEAASDVPGAAKRSSDDADLKFESFSLGMKAHLHYGRVLSLQPSANEKRQIKSS